MHKLIGSLLLVVLVTTIGLGWGLDQLFYGLTKRDSDPLAGYRVTGSGLASVLDKSKDQDVFMQAWREGGGVPLELLDPEDISLPSALLGSFYQSEPIALESDSGISLFFYLPDSGQILSMSPPATQKSRQHDVIRLLLTIMFYAGLIAFTLMWLYPLVRRLVNLSKVAREFGDGNFASRIQVSRRSYISDIEAEFNRMAQRIETLIDDNKLLSSAVSHDLRTPLARLRFGVDALSEVDDQTVRQKYLTRISDDLTEMEKLVDVLLGFARLDRRFEEVEKNHIDLVALVDAQVESISNGARRIQWQAAKEPLLIVANQQYIIMLVSNLLNNAERYSVESIKVSLERQKNQIVLSVEDDGSGIPESHRESVTKPFVRLGSTTGYKGYGMGLAIVRRIADVHGAKFSILTSGDLGGACMSVVFPRIADTREHLAKADS